MRIIKKHLSLFLISVVIATMLCSCGKVVDSSMMFSIPQFSEFFSISSNDEQENFILAGKLDAAKNGDIFIVPFIKETSHEACSLFVYVYFTGETPAVSIDSVTLTDLSGTAITSKTNINTMDVTQMTDSLFKGVIRIDTFQKSDTWFKNGNTLVLSIKSSVANRDTSPSTNTTYEITLERTKSILMPT